MISVIIPVLNEEKTIGKIVKLLMKNELVKEVIVIDDKSFDNTVKEAKEAGAIVVTSTKIGKGASMRDGLLVSKEEIVAFLDGDIEGYAVDIIEKLSNPILSGDADFVKSTFEREQGMVTKLAALPLLNIFFPSLLRFSQPLSGMIAGKKSFFEKIQFENDYGVDIGILIDMCTIGARMAEANLGTIQNRAKPWNKSGMALGVTRAILKRANSFSLANLKQFDSIAVIRDQMELAQKETSLELKKMIVFDMDNTILNGSFIDTAAIKFGFEKELMDIRSQDNDPLIVTKNIAKILKGRSVAELIQVIDSVPLVKDAIAVIKRLKKRGYIIGIITHSYDCIAAHIKIKIDADFALAYELEFSDSIATGEVKIPSFFVRNEKSICSHDMCKNNALLEVAEKYGIGLKNIIFVGDGEQDICVAKNAGVGVSFCSKNNTFNFIADKCIKQSSFRPILRFAQ